MNQQHSFIILLATLLILFAFLSCGDDTRNLDEQNNEDGGRLLEYSAEVSFIKSESDTISVIDVAVADDTRSRTEGLMNVLELPNENGMLFIFENEQPRSFWMANTPLSLDIIFVDSEMNIVRIHRNTQPYSQESIKSDEPARFVVEVNAGYTLDRDIREGMNIGIEGTDF